MTAPKEDTLTVSYMLPVAVLAGGLVLGGIVGYHVPRPAEETPAAPAQSDHSAQLARMEMMQRQTLGAVGGVQANQEKMWAEGLVVLWKRQGLLLKAQIAAGRLNVAQKGTEQALEKVPLIGTQTNGPSSSK